MTIGEIGNNFEITEKISFLSDRTLMDFDFLLCDYPTIHREIAIRANTYDVYENCQRRKIGLEDFLRFKKIPLVIFSAGNQRISYDLSDSTLEFNVDDLFPVPAYTVVKEDGRKLEIIEGTLFSSLLSKYHHLFTYDRSFSKYSGIALSLIPHYKKVIAFYNSNAVFLPKFHLEKLVSWSWQQIWT